jgi:hypothetical protein
VEERGVVCGGEGSGVWSEVWRRGQGSGVSCGNGR